MKDLRWLGPILDMSGYASAGRGYLKACDTTGMVNVQANDRSRSLNLKGKGMDDDILALYKRLSENRVAPDCPTVQHQVPDCFYKNSKTKLSIGYTIFEMSSIPKPWAPFCNDMDVLWTGSEYSKAAFLNGGVKTRIEVLPHAIDLDKFSPAAIPWSVSNKRSFAFISVFDFTSRKGWNDLLRAYWSAFKPDDDVCLILKVFYGGFDAEMQRDIVRRIVLYRADLKLSATPPVLVYGHDVPACDMPSLYRAADAYVGVSREGFGLPYAEAMACGLACIGPEVGGTRQFMTRENSFLVKYLGDEPISQEMASMNPTFRGLSWSRHSWEHLAALMRQVVSDKKERARVAARGMADVRGGLSFQAIGARINGLLP